MLEISFCLTHTHRTHPPVTTVVVVLLYTFQFPAMGFYSQGRRGLSEAHQVRNLCVKLLNANLPTSNIGMATLVFAQFLLDNLSKLQPSGPASHFTNFPWFIFRFIFRIPALQTQLGLHRFPVGTYFKSSAVALAETPRSPFCSHSVPIAILGLYYANVKSPGPLLGPYFK